jgi:hypothetical protein
VENLKFQPGDLVKFFPHKPPVFGIPEIGVVVESRKITHADRGYIYEITTVQLGEQQYNLPACDFKLIQRVFVK